ncbi:MAG: V-type ATP synthase subunit F [Candidatus Micrarchaeota archaeon]|nr:V-type ATP synthase subunit F [Candidatus Micrarchaeota archaeon]
MQEIAVIGDENFTIGFQTAGIRNVVLADKSNINKKFSELMKKPEMGIIIMHNNTFEMLSEKLKEVAMTQVKPTVVVLSHDVSAEENLRLMIKRSLGIDLWRG